MTSPLTAPPGGIPGAPTQVISGGGIDSFMPLIMQILAQSAQRKQRKAEEAVAGIPEGTTYGTLTPDQQKAYRRATGVKDLAPETVVRPLPANSEEAQLTRLQESLGIARGSTADIGMRSAMATRVATGSPHGLTTPAGIEAETRAGTDMSVASADIASARRSEAGSFKSATDKMSAATPGQNVEYTPAELAAYQNFNKFVPSDPIAAQLTAQTRAEVMKQGFRLASHPESATWATLLPPDVSAADVIGGIALGVGDIITSGINRKNVVAATYAQEEARALFDVAGKVSTTMNGRVSPTFVAAVMQGDPKAINTPAGQMVSRFMDAGFVANLTEMAAKGDPVSNIQTRLLELSRVPQISGNERLLSIYSNLFREMEAGKFARRDLGYDITDVTPDGPEAKAWLARQAQYVKQMGGLFQTGAGGFLWMGTKITGVGDREEQAPEESRQQQDAAILDGFLQAWADSAGVVPGTTMKPGSPLNVQLPPARRP